MRDLVIALHCSGGSARQWRALAQRLEPTYRFVAVDLHGHGVQPPWPAERAMTLADEAALIAPLLAPALSAERPRVHLIGHSYGGAVALKVASLQPDRVHSVAVYEPTMFRLLADDPASAAEAEEIEEVAAAMQRSRTAGDDLRAAQRFIDYWSGRGTFARLPEARRLAAALHVPSLATHWRALFGEQALSIALPRLPMPALVLTGADTVPTTWRIGQRLRGLLPRARHEVLPGLGHMGPVTQAAMVNERLVAFLHGNTHRSPDTPPRSQPAWAALPNRVPARGAPAGLADSARSLSSPQPLTRTQEALRS
jgi:pimeloyl-ACP methyl ester carboxylesterase